MGEKSGGGGRAGRGRAEGGEYTGGRIRWQSDLGPDGRLLPNGDVLVGPKFFDWPPETREVILAHEFSHGIIARTGATGTDEFWDTAEILKTGGYGGFWGANSSVEEASADVLAALVRPTHGIPMEAGIRKWAEGQYRKAGISPSAMAAQVSRLVGRMERGPEGAIWTLEEL